MSYAKICFKYTKKTIEVYLDSFIYLTFNTIKLS